MNKLFVDDEWTLPGRFPGCDWICVANIEEAKRVLIQNKGKITHLSLDSDLGLGDGKEGPDLTAWLSEEWFLNGNDYWPTESLTIHSRNSQGRARMKDDCQNSRYNPRTWIYEDILI